MAYTQHNITTNLYVGDRVHGARQRFDFVVCCWTVISSLAKYSVGHKYNPPRLLTVVFFNKSIVVRASTEAKSRNYNLNKHMPPVKSIRRAVCISDWGLLTSTKTLEFYTTLDNV